MKRLFCLLVLVTSCGISQQNNVSLVVLGTVQDGGSPHIGCEKECCSPLWKHPDPTRKVVSLGIIDYENKKTFLFEATPDLPEQLKLLKKVSNLDTETPDGIFLTHAHMGHYTGLMFLGREALGSKNVPVYTMPKMESFLKENGPWNQLIKLNNIALKSLHNQQIVSLTPNISVVPFTVPHRDEYSETVGFKIIGPEKSVLFIPDIDKWSKWETSIIEAIKDADYAFLDATFYDNKELNYRDISEIPHPFVIESLELFKNLSNKEKSKIHFIHFNHTNPLLTPNSPETKHTILEGFRIAKFKQVIGL
jgi:pyrroloquinoline quinone biosynthesis protein B